MAMKITTVLSSALLLALAACGDSVTPSDAPATSSTAAAPSSAKPTAPHEATPGTATFGKVLETMDAGNYTYVKVEADDDDPAWWAAPRFEVAAGDTVLLPRGALEQRNYKSPTLDRTFERVYFAQWIKRTKYKDVDGIVQAAHGTPPADGGTPPSAVEGVEKAEGGRTVEEIFAEGKELAGQDVLLRGRVVKFSSGILGKNWLHVQDGTGAPGSNDLVVTTQAAVAVGDTVLVKGRLVADKDLGYGYRFALLVEDAEVTAE